MKKRHPKRLGLDHLAIFLLGMCALINLYSTQPILVQLANQLNVSVATATLTISATTFGVAILAPFAGAISDHLGRKKIMLTAVVIMTLATGLCMVATSFPILLIGRLLQGMATPFVFAVAVAYINEEYPPKQAMRLNSLYVAGTAFGGFSGRFFSGLAFDTFNNWPSSFSPLAIILILTFITTLISLPNDQKFVPSRSILASLGGTVTDLKDWRILATCFIGASLLFQQVASFTFGSLELQTPPISLSTLQVGLVFVVFLVPTFITPLVGNAMVHLGRLKIFWISAWLGILGLCLTLIPTVWPFILGLACSCVAVFAGQSCSLGFIGQYVKHNKSAAVGLYLTSYYLGGTLGGIVPAKLYTLLGWWSTILMISLIMIVSLALSSIAWKPNH